MLKLGADGFVRWAVIAAVLLFLFAVAIGGHRKLSQDGNESAAVAALKAISSAMEKWYRSQNPPSYVNASLSALGQSYPTYIDAELSKGIKDGYSFTLLPLSHYEYFCVATPLSQGITGNKIFRVTESGTVEVKTAENWHPVK